MSKPDPLHGFGFGSGVWVIVTTVLAVFVGSYYAGRCAPVLGWLHGLLSWAVMTLLVVYGMTSLITGAVSTAGSVAATTAQVSATAANQSGTTPSVVDTAKQQVQAAVASAASAASSPQAEQTARETADTAARGVARASWFSFAALIVGAIIAIVSGGAGFRHQPPYRRKRGYGNRRRYAAGAQPRSARRRSSLSERLSDSRRSPAAVVMRRNPCVRKRLPVRYQRLILGRSARVGGQGRDRGRNRNGGNGRRAGAQSHP